MPESSDDSEKAPLWRHLVLETVNMGRGLESVLPINKKVNFTAEKLHKDAAAEVSEIRRGLMNRKDSSAVPYLNGHDRKLDLKKRNRENAKFTRLRKRIYVQKLSSTLFEMNSKHIQDLYDIGRQNDLLVDRVRTRLNLLSRFFSCWNSGVADREKWDQLCDNETLFSMPCVLVQQSGSDVLKFQGLDEISRGSCTFRTVIEGSNHRESAWKSNIKHGATLKILFEISETSPQSAGDMIMTEFAIYIIGPRVNITQSGILRCSFSSFNKISFLEILFDVRGIHQELEQHGYNLEDLVVPDTLEAAQSLIEKDLCQKGFTNSDQCFRKEIFNVVSSFHKDLIQCGKFIVCASDKFEICFSNNEFLKISGTLCDKESIKGESLFDIFKIDNEGNSIVTFLLKNASNGYSGSRLISTRLSSSACLFYIRVFGLNSALFKATHLYVEIIPCSSGEPVSTTTMIETNYLDCSDPLRSFVGPSCHNGFCFCVEQLEACCLP